MTVKDLLTAMWLGSSNVAAKALAEKVEGSEEKFVEMMNLKAQQLGLTQTIYFNCTGLAPRNYQKENVHLNTQKIDNYSTAKEVIALKHALLSTHPEIEEFYKNPVRGDEDDHVKIRIIRNGQVVEIEFQRLDRVNVKGTSAYLPEAGPYKTGSMNEAGMCYSGVAEIQDGLQLYATGLGFPTQRARNVRLKEIIGKIKSHRWNPLKRKFNRLKSKLDHPDHTNNFNLDKPKQIGAH